MNVLFEYAYHWLRASAVRLYRPFDMTLTRDWVSAIEGGRPGFAFQLRLVALDALRSDDPQLVHKAIAALAVVGERADCVQLRAVSGVHAVAARTAIFELEHSAHAG
jgi:hypothetical protein